MTKSGIERFIVFIPNTHGPYGYEMAQILAYPNGFSFRFRFDAKWVHEKVKNILDRIPGISGYVLLRDFDSGQLYPIRYVTVKTAFRVGPIYYFEYTLEAMMEIGPEDVSQRQLSKFRSNFAESHETILGENIGGKHLQPLVFLTNISPDVRDSSFVTAETEDPESSRWMNIVSTLGEISYFANVEFFRLISLSKNPRAYSLPPVRDGAWTLEEGVTYTLRLVQFVPKGELKREVPNDISVRVDNSVIVVIRGEQRSVGKYDILSFVIRVDSFARNAFSFIDLEYRPHPQHQEKIQPRISVPIQIRRSSGRSLLRFLFGGETIE